MYEKYSFLFVYASWDVLDAENNIVPALRMSLLAPLSFFRNKKEILKKFLSSEADDEEESPYCGIKSHFSLAQRNLTSPTIGSLAN